MKHLAVLYKEHSARNARRPDRMSHHQNSLAALINFPEKAQQLVGSLGIQRARRLVRKNQLGRSNNRPGDSGALLLTA